MFKSIEVINQTGAEIDIILNSEGIVFISDVELDSNVVGLDGEKKVKPGSAIMLSNGMTLNSELSAAEIVNLFKGE